MNRRTFLTTTGATGSAVLGAVGLDHVTGAKARTPRISVETDPIDPDRNVSLSVSVVQQPSSNEPAQLQIALTNTGDRRLEFLFGATPPFSQYFSADSSELVLLPEEREHISSIEGETNNGDGNTPLGQDPLVPESPIEGCWKLRTEIAVFGGATRRTLKPTETVVESYTLLANAGTSACLQPGQYRFESAKYLGNEKEWGFTVILDL